MYSLCPRSTFLPHCGSTPANSLRLKSRLAPSARPCPTSSAQHPDLRRHLYTDEGKLRAFVNVYLNDEDVRYLQKEATAVKDGDSISIVPSIAGGR